MNNKAAWWVCLTITFLWCMALIYGAQKSLERDRTNEAVKNHYIWLDPDDYMWVLYSQEAAEKGELKLKKNTFDNFGEGRPIHWSSIPSWGLRTLGFAQRTWANLTGTPTGIRESIEKAACAFNPLLLLVAGMGAAWILIKNCGPIYGTGFYLILFTLPATQTAFNPLHPDHQGLLLATNAAFLASFFLGYKTLKRSYFLAAGLFAGLGLWTSAANTIPYLALTAIAFLAVILATRRETPVDTFNILAKGWITLSLAGAAISVLGWAIEYAPTIPLNLEANSPLHTLALLGAGLGIAGILHFLAQNKKRGEKELAAGVILILPIVLAIVILKENFIALTDPFMERVHWVIIEMQAPKNYSFNKLGAYLSLLIGGTLVTVASTNKENLQKNAPAIMVILLGFLFLLLSGSSLRFENTLLLVGVLLIPLAVVPIAQNPISKNILTGTLILAGTISVLTTSHILNENLDNFKGKSRESLGLAAKGLAQTAAEINKWGQETGKTPTVAYGDPGRSTVLLYFLNGNVGQTIYWESGEGMKKTATILGNANEKDAMQQIMDSNVTHLVINSLNDAGTLVLGNFGRDALTEAQMTNYKHYTLGKWFDKTTRPAWLKENPTQPEILEVDREALEKALKN